MNETVGYLPQSFLSDRRFPDTTRGRCCVYPHVTGEETDKYAHNDIEGEWWTQVNPSCSLLLFNTYMGLTACITAR